MSKEYTFNPGDFVVYPAHGVGQVRERQTTTVGGQDVDLIAIHFTKDKLTMRIPSEDAMNKGLRAVVSPAVMESVISALEVKPKTKRAPWSKRSAEYTAKISSGDPIALAEVVRDLYRDPALTNQTYSERQLFEKAFSRLVPEYAVVQKVTEQEASVQLESILQGVADKVTT